jgi:hypothetical protein
MFDFFPYVLRNFKRGSQTHMLSGQVSLHSDVLYFAGVYQHEAAPV